MASVDAGELDKWPWAWVLRDIQVLDAPVPYKHKHGAVIWTVLDSATRRRLTRALRLSHATDAKRNGASTTTEVQLEAAATWLTNNAEAGGGIPLSNPVTGHYVRYHTRSIAGQSFNTTAEAFKAFSGNPVKHLKGACVWIIENEGDRYLLQAVFKVEEVGPTPPGAEMGLANEVAGRAGVRFIEIDIGKEPWWPGFFKSIGHGGLAISPIASEYLEHLQALARRQMQENGFIARYPG